MKSSDLKELLKQNYDLRMTVKTLKDYMTKIINTIDKSIDNPQELREDMFGVRHTLKNSVEELEKYEQ